MIEKIPFGKTGHQSSRIIFGAAALGGMRQEKADSVIDLVRSYGINHFDVAISYGDAELRLSDYLQDHRNDVFLATKTGDRDGPAARRSIESSLERMKVEQVDMIQFHNLAQEKDWDIVMSKGGALDAAIKAQEEGLVKYIGVTGHGTKIAGMHLKSLERFDFAAVLLPYSLMSLKDEQYKREFEALYKICQEQGVAIQTIKAIARRRWQAEDTSKRFSWYEPIREESVIKNIVHWVLRRPGLFFNSTSDATLLKTVLDAALEPSELDDAELERVLVEDSIRMSQEALFERDVQDDVRPIEKV